MWVEAISPCVGEARAVKGELHRLYSRRNVKLTNKRYEKITKN
jgi:hypothetical protein